VADAGSAFAAGPPAVSIVSPANGATYLLNETLSADYSCVAAAGLTIISCTGTTPNDSGTMVRTTRTSFVSTHDTVDAECAVKDDVRGGRVSGPQLILLTELLTADLDDPELNDGVETVLRPGDTVVQNGTRHRWANRGTEPAVMAAFQVGARRAGQ
jgi:hypothetical protein